MIRSLINNYIRLKRLVFKGISNIKTEGNNPNIIHPTLIEGNGKIKFGENVTLGYNPSKGLYYGYSHIDLRNGASITIGNNVTINNHFNICADRAKITIEDNTIFGTDLLIMNSDYHHTDPKLRNTTYYPCQDITIGKNVFVGSKVTILKGVTIGNDSIIGACSVVTKNIPENQEWAGNPAKFIKCI